MLITKGANVNAKNPNGRTTLFNATVEGSKETAELLIAKGADVNAKAEGGETPLDWAIKNPPYSETVGLLRKHGGKLGEGLKAEGN